MKTFERLVLKYILRIIYYVSYIIPVKKRVVFATYRKDSLEGNFKYIYDKLQSKAPNLKCKFLYNDRISDHMIFAAGTDCVTVKPLARFL